MAITFIGDSEVNQNATIPIPSEAQAGDFLLVRGHTQGTAEVPAPTGWSIETFTVSTQRHWIAWRFHDGVETSATFAHSTRSIIKMSAWRGVDTNNPISYAPGNTLEVVDPAVAIEYRATGGINTTGSGYNLDDSWVDANGFTMISNWWGVNSAKMTHAYRDGVEPGTWSTSVPGNSITVALYSGDAEVEANTTDIELWAPATIPDIPGADENLTNTSTGRLGDIQTFVVPRTGTYTLEAIGAQGGMATRANNSLYYGGLGARMKGDFELEEGEILHILVGQEGTHNGLNYASGGGGTFIVKEDGTPLLIAGGGGGYGVGTSYNNWWRTHASIDTAGRTAFGGATGAAGAGGDNGMGGAHHGTQTGLAGGGGGLLGDGGGVGGGIAYVNGGQGGTTGGTANSEGGFGAGGGMGTGSTGWGITSGGGGYSGGGAGYAASAAAEAAGGGGGSLNVGINQDNEEEVGYGHGLATITAPSVPGEPSPAGVVVFTPRLTGTIYPPVKATVYLINQDTGVAIETDAQEDGQYGHFIRPELIDPNAKYHIAAYYLDEQGELLTAPSLWNIEPKGD